MTAGRVGSCGTCKHWRPVRAQDGKTEGDCMRIEQPGSLARLAGGDAPDLGVLCTRADFGCVQHEATP